MSFISTLMYIVVYILCRFMVINLPHKKNWLSSLRDMCQQPFCVSTTVKSFALVISGRISSKRRIKYLDVTKLRFLLS